jgi:hypothetical protein
MAISGLFFHRRHLFGWGPLPSITEGTIHHPVITLPIIMSHIEFGSPATGKSGGRPAVGKECGFQAIGNINDK